MKKIASLSASLTILLFATSAFACGPSWNSPAEIGLLSLLISVLPMAIYSVLSAIYLLIVRKKQTLSFKPAMFVWLKATTLAYLSSTIAIFVVMTVSAKLFRLPENLIFTFVATAPLVVLAGYFTRVFYANQN